MIGSNYSADFVVSQNEVNSLVKISGDNNPRHIDAYYSSETIFKRPILHGFLPSSKFSKVLGLE